MVKPLLEILAGVPTIVYGLFALMTVAPHPRDWFAQPDRSRLILADLCDRPRAS